MREITIKLIANGKELETVEGTRALVIVDDGKDGRVCRYNLMEISSCVYLMDAALGTMIENFVDDKDLGYTMFMTYLTMASTAYETTIESGDMDTHDMFDMAMEIDRFLKESGDVLVKRDETE